MAAVFFYNNYYEFYQLYLVSYQLNYHARFGSSVQTNMEGQAKNFFVVPKSEQDLNIRCKNPELSFARKNLPLVKG